MPSWKMPSADMNDAEHLRTVGEFVRYASACFRNAGIENPSLDASVLLSDLFGKDRSFLILHENQEVPENLRKALLERIQERKRRRPVSQLTGKKEFYGRTFFVNEDVLTPRPETEELMDLLLKENLPEKSLILDLCSGSGCIGITLLCENPLWECHFSDISERAMAVLQKNGENLVSDFSLKSKCFTGNLYDPIYDSKYDSKYDSNAEEKSVSEKSFRRAVSPLYHAILCNPPYIHPDEKPGLMPELSYEPEGALFHDHLPDLYFEILDGAKDLLLPGGILLCELSPRWAEDVLKYGNQIGMPSEVVRDLSGADRFVVSRKLQ